MKRYDLYDSGRGITKFLPALEHETDDGEWVKFTDHESALSQAERDKEDWKGKAIGWRRQASAARDGRVKAEQQRDALRRDATKIIESLIEWANAPISVIAPARLLLQQIATTLPASADKGAT